MTFQNSVSSCNLDWIWTEYSNQSKIDAHNLRVAGESSSCTEYCSPNQGKFRAQTTTYASKTQIVSTEPRTGTEMAPGEYIVIGKLADDRVWVTPSLMLIE